MDDREVVKLFLEKGYQISKKALPLVSDNPEAMILELEKLKQRPLVITEYHIKKISKKTKKPRIKILKEFGITKNPIRINDYVQHFVSRYEKTKNILSQHMSLEKLISINKINPEITEFSLIGVVREKNKNTLIIEDLTGETELFFNGLMKQKLLEIGLEDVIGLKCKRTGENFFVHSVVYPDIPLNRKIGKTERKVKIMIAFITDENREKILVSIEEVSYIFNLSESQLINDKIYNITQNNNPTLLQIDSVKILMVPKEFSQNLTKETLISILKRRHISPVFDLKTHIKNNNFVLEEIPDIVISNLDESFYKNYKGTTIISNSDSKRTYIVDLKTRKVIEEKL